MFSFSFHKSLEFLHIGCKKPAAYMIPYENEEKALEQNEPSRADFSFPCAGIGRFTSSKTNLTSKTFSLPGNRSPIR